MPDSPFDEVVSRRLEGDGTTFAPLLRQLADQLEPMLQGVQRPYSSQEMVDLDGELEVVVMVLSAVHASVREALISHGFQPQPTYKGVQVAARMTKAEPGGGAR